MTQITTQSQVEKRLILCVDGVPYTAIERLRQQGLFHLFQPASRVISTFPAMTNVALKELFGAASPSGYEAFYFDRELNRFSGGASNYVGNRNNSLHVRTYHHFVDYQEPVHYEFLVYVMPQSIYREDLERFLAAFEATDSPVFVGYLKSTDGLIHLGGQEKLDWAMRLLDDALMKLYEAHQGKMEILVFSDHGNHIEKGQRLLLRDQLRHQGLQVGSRLRSERSVVVPEFGLVGFASIYTSADPAPIASDVAQLEGVDFAIYRQDDAVMVVHQSGWAKIEFDPVRHTYRYEPGTGDPLHLLPALQQLREQRLVGAEDFVADRVWFDATTDHVFPDIVHRVYQAMNHQVINGADILLSLDDRTYAGHAFFEGMVDLVATHGNARPGSSTGFLMSTHTPLPASVRAADVPSYLKITPRHVPHIL